MANPQTPAPMKVTQMGECTNLWSELTKSPQCVIGGFILNLSDLRRLSGDSATMSMALDRFLDNCLYVSDSSKNPEGRSVSELYNSGASIEVVFDPLLSVELEWDGLNYLLTNADVPDEYSTVNYEEMLDQMETRLALFANRPLQRRLIARLKEKQKEYLRMGKWYHFHERFQDFWTIAYEVCLNKTSKPSLSQKDAKSTMLDWIFLTNDDNRSAYRKQLHAHFEAKLHMSATLHKLLVLAEKMDAIIGRNSRGKARPANYKNDLQSVIADELIGLWYSIWVEDLRPMLDAPLAQSFRENMRAIDNLVLDELIPLSTGNLKISPKTHAETFSYLKELLLTAMAGWANLIRIPVKNSPARDPEFDATMELLDGIIQQMKISYTDSEEITE